MSSGCWRPGMRNVRLRSTCTCFLSSFSLFSAVTLSSSVTTTNGALFPPGVRPFPSSVSFSPSPTSPAVISSIVSTVPTKRPFAWPLKASNTHSPSAAALRRPMCAMTVLNVSHLPSSVTSWGSMSAICTQGPSLQPSFSSDGSVLRRAFLSLSSEKMASTRSCSCLISSTLRYSKSVLFSYSYEKNPSSLTSSCVSGSMG
mmetsp:Transcript_1200/g.4307  ORF Transcript_1200/g.4307 Transcript_1200/m.4307 type:complete len:201 (+) Transcript_1200:1380-1982(+)